MPSYAAGVAATSCSPSLRRRMDHGRGVTHGEQLTAALHLPGIHLYATSTMPFSYAPQRILISRQPGANTATAVGSFLYFEPTGAVDSSARRLRGPKR